MREIGGCMGSVLIKPNGKVKYVRIRHRRGPNT